MSGGAWDFVYLKFDDVSFRLQHGNKDESIITNKKRKKLGKIVDELAIAIHDIEWVDSGDYGYEEEDRAMDACFRKIEKILNKDKKTILKVEKLFTREEFMEIFNKHDNGGSRNRTGEATSPIPVKKDTL